ncbi:sensor histidine kinase [Corallococcus coralloides DSM 2259]|uniref:histidine kinase n=1 Tax=Corallococcus coralloides (strain ATCC 25202 / DSM 2259 / NBRC 100086 / M2) TaxID=1144275 RepID=H8MTS9_CORCM|nr:HAMP domain-containing sensor histidine kinase [Corallococcus coralloides]AFE09828.1 sensor histidine kinase [Corallococcus coralloides DSM 2259]
MPRRLLPTLVALALGLAGLGVGLGYLHRIFAAEREDARTSLRSRREALEQYARAALGQALREGMEDTRDTRAAAKEDPLVATPGLYLREQGEQVLPRMAQFDTAGDAPAKERYARLRAGTEVADEDEGPWKERLERLALVEQSLKAKDRKATQLSLMALLQHRTRFVLASTRDLPSLLVVLEDVAARGDVVPDLMRGLVRDGLVDGQGGGRLEGLQRLLLLKRSRFTPEDFDFLRERVAALSTRVGVPVADFEARVRELATSPLPMPANVQEPMLTRSGWYLEPLSGGDVRGLALDLPGLLAELTREMRERGLLEADGRVTLSVDAAVVPLTSLPMAVESSMWARSEDALERRYRLKTWMLALCAALALIIAALAFVAQQRKYRFLELKSDFVATVSHELRTPLASIRLLAETLEWRVAEGADAKDYPARIIREADGLGFLVENLLSFNRIDKGRWVPKLAPVRLDELVSNLRRDLESGAPVPVELTADVDARELNADAQLLRLLLANLARNACAYNTRSPVRLHVQTLPGGRVHFTDNGTGIPASEWERVFGEFYRLSGRGGREVPGSGLGLALCRKIARLHGGTLRVAASSPEGTTFELTLPEYRPETRSTA